MHNGIYAGLLISVVSFVWFTKRGSKNPDNLPYPPGPKPLPLIGNVNDVPREVPWKVFQEWGRKYGDIIYFHTFGKPIIILNSVTAAHDLLDKRGSIYSYRPQFAMANENFSLTSMDYSEKSKKQRKYLQSYFSRQLLPNYYSTQIKEVHRMLYDVLQDPDNYRQHIKRMAAGITMMLAYGHEVKTMDDTFIKIAEKGVKTIEAAGAVGAHIVDLIPWLRFIPEWLPVADGTAVPCYTTALLEETKGQDDEGTLSALETAFTMLLADPLIQARVQAEMDVIVGKDRLPDFSYRDQMPYLNTSLASYGVQTPVGVPHRASEDDFYNGYYIPKDTTVMANQWAMLNDERLYPEPSKFNPDRFLEGEGRIPQFDPRNIAFGFGRRQCPGNVLAENTLWIATACLFYAFKATPAKDEKGVDIPIVVEYTEHAVRHPKPLKCTFRPRRANSAALIHQAFEV
ncbi:cytochrome P450 [Gymnopilus junonius]|uniref:Cytochrome P450 n=1 Tax=Gymnopilus junonius TaxID=109634 RepID=A0A9P5TPF5_GYMJU|nr:cytochrome P450 [Gymnopilus junonius]